MKLSVTTLGWPSSPLDKVLGDIKSAGGFAGVDFRGLGEELDITRLPAFNAGLDKTLAEIKSAGLVVSGLSTSTRLIADGKGDRKEGEVAGYCKLADRIGVKLVRVFGGQRRKDQSCGKWMAEAVESLKRMVDGSAPSQAVLCVETHDDWCHTADVAELLDKVASPRAAALWDIMISSLAGGETPAQSVANLGSRICYTHLKDGYVEAGKTHLTLPGEGKVDLLGAVKELKKIGYDGWLTFEWEKRWHPELPDAAAALPAYRKLMSQVI